MGIPAANLNSDPRRDSCHVALGRDRDVKNTKSTPSLLLNHINANIQTYKHDTLFRITSIYYFDTLLGDSLSIPK